MTEEAAHAIEDGKYAAAPAALGDGSEARPGVVTAPVLDACCGSRTMWFPGYRDSPLVEFCDVRDEALFFRERGRDRVVEVRPDTVADFADLPFPDGSFALAVMDPPHLLRAGSGAFRAKYGELGEGWEGDVRRGVSECMRVLRHEGVLVFKWSEAQVPLSRVLAALEWEPLFGHTTTKRGTHWMCFVKGVSRRRGHAQEATGP
ncbi:MAG: class I SAM-dependent methyltransferase [Coriobacteriales bacterium]|jgi:SAM-dependent methyltransferase|nr:class I SAM-dependent methyltransferase [Coriobacteriales bacterium]